MGSMSENLFEKHRDRLDAAVEACASRAYFSAFDESPSPRVYGESAAAEGKAAYDAWLGKTFPLVTPGASGTVATERSPYGFDLGISYPRASDVDALLAAAAAGMRPWRDAGPDGRTGVCLEILDRLHARVFELANAVQHTSGQAFVMAFQAGGAHALDRALESIAYAWTEMTRTPATAIWEKPGRSTAAHGEDVHGRAARHRAGDRLQHLPDLELVAGAVRVAGHRQPGRREAAPGRGAAARDHRAGLPGGAGRGRLRPQPRHARRRGPGRPARRDAGGPSRGEADRLHRRQRLRRLAGAERPPGHGVHREGRREHGRRRLHRRLRGDVPEPRVLLLALLRPDVHGAAERLPARRRHRDRPGPRRPRPRSAPGSRPPWASCSATTPARSSCWAGS